LSALVFRNKAISGTIASLALHAQAGTLVHFDLAFAPKGRERFRVAFGLD